MTQVLWRSPWLWVQREGAADEYFAARDEVLLVAFDADDNVLLVEEPAPAFGTRQLFLPGGAVEDGESVVEAAQRELREETGYRAAVIVQVGSIQPWPKYLRVTSHLVVATDLSLDPLAPDEPHTLILHRRPRDDIKADVKRGAITDARIIAASLCL